MKTRKKAVKMIGLCIVLCMGIAGCSKESEADSTFRAQAEAGGEQGNNEKTENGRLTDNSAEIDMNEVTGTDSTTENSGEGLFYDGANLSGRVVAFSEEGLTITPSALIIYEDGSMEGGIAAPGYESEKDNITVTYKENTTFQIVTFSIAAQAESSREDTDKSSIKKDTDVNIFGVCVGEKQWSADKVVITRWE